jgi:hypothetical protein
VEASDAERERVATVVRRFRDARAAANWREACACLAARQRRESEALAGERSCARAMGKLAAGVPPRAFVREAELERVLSLRVGGGGAFLIYARAGGKVYATALRREGDAWKIVSVAPTALS